MDQAWHDSYEVEVDFVLLYEFRRGDVGEDFGDGVCGSLVGECVSRRLVWHFFEIVGLVLLATGVCSG